MALDGGPAGRWWRADHYEIRDGVIRPEEGATLEEFDPWRISPGDRQKRITTPPYAELANLVRGHPTEWDIEDWCSRYGLLGLLPHKVLSIVQVSRQSPSRLHTASVTIRSPVGWEPSMLVTGLSSQPRPRPRHWPREGVILRPLGKPWAAPHQLPVRAALAPYFDREVIKQGPSRLFSNSERFWQAYGEPLEEFIGAAKILADALDSLGQTRNPSQKLSEDGEEDRARAIKVLNNLSELTSPTLLETEDGEFREFWLSPSLLGNLARMAAQDLLDTKCVNSCTKCRKLFRSTSPLAKYCSKKCQWAVQKKTFRANAKCVAQSKRQKVASRAR